MGSTQPAAVHCLCCLRALATAPAEQMPAVCEPCWNALTPTECAARIEAARMTHYLRCLVIGQGFVEQDDEQKNSTMDSIAKSHERFVRLAKQLIDEFDATLGQFQSMIRAVNQRIEEDQRNEHGYNDPDDEEPWRKSL